MIILKTSHTLRIPKYSTKKVVILSNSDDANRIEVSPITHRPLDGNHRVREEDEFIFENTPGEESIEDPDEYLYEDEAWGDDDDEPTLEDLSWQYGDDDPTPDTKD